MADHDAAAGVVSRILSEADMAARPGQYDRLVAIANEVAALSADERATAQVQACDAHISQVRWAEAVGTKLVEVICQQERTRQIHVETIHALSDDADILRAERDAARADLSDRTEEVSLLRQQRDEARAEVRALLTIRATLEGEIARLASEVAALSAEIAHERFHEMGNWRAFRETLLERDAARAELADLRERIATQIEEYGGPPQCDCEVCRYCYWSRAIEGAARIARDEGVERNG